MREIISLNRRTLLQTGFLLGSGLILGTYFPGKTTQAKAAEPSRAFLPNAFIRIEKNGSITVFINKSEMGQGVYTSLPMLIAEELEADWKNIRIEPAPVAPAYNHTMFGPIMVTGGSTSIRSEWDRLRKMGASARLMLIAAAAKLWKVDDASCIAQQSYIVHSPSQKRIPFGDLVEIAADLEPPQEIPLKDPREFKIIGKSRDRIDIPDKTTGKAVFGIDVIRPDMLVALVARPPVFGAKMVHFDDKAAKAVKGVKHVIPVASGVAVVADGFYSADRGRDALSIDWDEGPLAGLDSASQGRDYAAMAEKDGAVATSRGDVNGALQKAAKAIEAVYDLPYLAHAPMEPLNCVVELKADSCEIWTGTQMQTTDRNAAAVVAGLEPEQVKLHTTMLGSGFGRRAVPDSHFVKEAVEVAKATKVPVKVYWTREDDIRGGYYRPRAFNLMRGGLDDKGKVVAWHHRIVGQSIMKGTFFEQSIHDGIDETSVEGASDAPYLIDNFLVDYHMAPQGVPVLWWRSVGHSYTAYVKECFLDELAMAAGKDPYQFRRQLLPPASRELGVLDLAAEKGGWSTPVKKGRARGLAVHASYGSYVAQVAEVSLDPGGNITVHRVTCAVDCGQTVNPNNIEAQMESAIVFGLSAAIYGEISFGNGRVQQANFDNYEVLRIDAMPEINVHIVPSREAPGGIGEPGVPPLAPAVANAIFALTGTPMRALPMTRKRVQEAMKAT